VRKWGQDHSSCKRKRQEENGTATRNKKYHREKDAVVLSPCSANAVHKEIRFYQGDELKVQGVMVAVLKFK
jgi:SOS-response transcriptional repressor LexA